MTTRRKRRERRERRMAKEVKPRDPYPPPRIMLWTCTKCGETWATRINGCNYEKRPDAVGTSICDACIEKMGEQKP